MGLPVIIRKAREDELRLVYSAWIGTQKKSKLAKLMHPKVFAAGLHRTIERILWHEHTTAVVAEYEGIVVGFVVWTLMYEPDPYECLIHYVFVKEPYRRQGIMKALLTYTGEDPESPDPLSPGPGVSTTMSVCYTHAPEPWRNITPPSSWVYDPWAAWALEE